MGLAPLGPAQALFKIAPGNFVLSRFASGRHPWRPALVIRSPVRRFQRGTQHPCHIQTAEKPEGGPVRQKIAEALTAGRGEAQGCAERARFTGTLHRARPESRREKAEDKIAGSNFGQHLCWPRRGEPQGWGEQSAKRRFSLPGAGVARGAAVASLARSPQRSRHKAEML
jgi:hypothetical protein